MIFHNFGLTSCWITRRVELGYLMFQFYFNSITSSACASNDRIVMQIICDSIIVKLYISRIEWLVRRNSADYSIQIIPCARSCIFKQHKRHDGDKCIFNIISWSSLFFASCDWSLSGYNFISNISYWIKSFLVTGAYAISTIFVLTRVVGMAFVEVKRKILLQQQAITHMDRTLPAICYDRIQYHWRWR